MKKGKIIIISGPSGAGKTTLHNKLLQATLFKNKLVKSVSATTRQRRPGEKHGRDYVFISRKMFLYKKKAGHFIESEKVFDNYYATPRKSVRDVLAGGKSVLLCIDVKGAKTIHHKCPEAARIFIKTPSLDDLDKRLRKRGTENNKIRSLRLSIARQELKEEKSFDYVVVNGVLAEALKKIVGIVKEELSL